MTSCAPYAAKGPASRSAQDGSPQASGQIECAPPVFQLPNGVSCSMNDCVGSQAVLDRHLEIERKQQGYERLDERNVQGVEKRAVKNRLARPAGHDKRAAPGPRVRRPSAHRHLRWSLRHRRPASSGSSVCFGRLPPDDLVDGIDREWSDANRLARAFCEVEQGTSRQTACRDQLLLASHLCGRLSDQALQPARGANLILTQDDVVADQVEELSFATRLQQGSHLVAVWPGKRLIRRHQHDGTAAHADAATQTSGIDCCSQDIGGAEASMRPERHEQTIELARRYDLRTVEAASGDRARSSCPPFLVLLPGDLEGKLALALARSRREAVPPSRQVRQADFVERPWTIVAVHALEKRLDADRRARLERQGVEVILGAVVLQ